MLEVNMFMDLMDKIHEIGLVPVVVLNNVDETIPTLEALKAGDVPVAEICFRTPCAKDCLKLATQIFKDVLIGAGTVINVLQCKEAIEAGAKFIVSPGLSKEVAKICKDNNVLYLPGVVTPTEIMEALELGINNVKFFPAGVYGGLKAINALGSAFTTVKFMPTGGVNNDNLKEFASNKKIIACGGSWLLKGTKEEIILKCLEARKIIKEARNNG